MDTKVGAALEKLTIRMNEKIESLKKSMIDEVVEIKKLLDQNNTLEGNASFNEWVTNGLKGEFSSKEGSKTYEESIRQGHSTWNGWLASTLKGEQSVDDKVQLKDSFTANPSYNQNYIYGRQDSGDSNEEINQDATPDRKPFLVNGEIVTQKHNSKPSNVSNIVLEMSEKPSIVGSIKIPEKLLTTNTIGTNELAGDPNRILAQLTTLPGTQSSGEDSMKYAVPSPQNQANLIYHVPYPYNLAGLNMYNNGNTQNLLYPVQVPVGELQGKNCIRQSGTETKLSGNYSRVIDDQEAVSKNTSMPGTDHVARLSSGDELKKPKKKRARRDPTNREFNCDQCQYTSAYKENVVKHFKIRHSQIKDIHCTECDFKTNVRTNLTHHVEAVHLKKKRFECTYCDYRFVQKRNLQNHIKRNHEQEPKRSKVVKKEKSIKAEINIQHQNPVSFEKDTKELMIKSIPYPSSESPNKDNDNTLKQFEAGKEDRESSQNYWLNPSKVNIKLEHHPNDESDGTQLQEPTLTADQMTLNHMFNLAVQDLTSNEDVFENTIESIPQPPLLDSTDSMTDIFEILEHPSLVKAAENFDIFSLPLQ